MGWQHPENDIPEPQGQSVMRFPLLDDLLVWSSLP